MSSANKSRDDAIFDRYVDSRPNAQNAIDVVPGWNSALPYHVGVHAGPIPLFDDHRIRWLVEQYGTIANRHILELGPLEGGHTYMLAKEGAFVDSVEANQLAYLRCLIARELLGMRHVRFHLGDFVAWLREVPIRYDVVVASGVLYHVQKPLELLTLIAKRTRAVYFWTHYMSEEAMPLNDIRRSVFVGEPEMAEFRSLPVRLYRRTYAGAQKTAAFCGGLADQHRWMHIDDLFQVLKLLGFCSITTAHQEPNHVNGPAISIFASK